MDVSEIKEYVFSNNKIKDVLEALGCHNIKEKTEYISCGMPNGDNKQSTIIYKTEYLPVTAYTRNIIDKNGYSDLLSLVAFITQDNMLAHNIKFICDVIGLDYYYDFEQELPESIRFTKWLISEETEEEEQEIKLKPITEDILSYYYPYPNKLFEDDGIELYIQKEFEIGFDLRENTITIPIRDDIGTLVGVKGRTLEQNIDNKYWYLEKCAKSQILYGLYKTHQYIKKQNEIIIVESEKSVMKLWQHGIKNVVAIAGHNLSKTQAEKIGRLNVNEVILCYDEDAYRQENGVLSKKEYIQEIEKFLKQQKVSAMLDIKRKVLNDKESPADNMKKFKVMYDKRIRLQ